MCNIGESDNSTVSEE